MGRDRFKDEKDYDEMIMVNSGEEIRLIKSMINKIIPNDLKIKAANDSQIALIKSIKSNEITICAGPAGTGKTFVAMGIALNLLKKSTNRFKKIYLVKSVKPLKDEEVGFLPGDIQEKIEPAMWSFYLNMEKVVTDASLKQLVEKDIVRPAPLAFIRGASLDDCIIIADEMQNVTFDNSRTLLTRIGSNAKIILLGDTNQIDMRNKDDSSLEILLDLFRETQSMGVIKMSDEDTNIRNPLISVIEKKYKEYIEVNKPNNNGNGRKKQRLND